MRVRRVDNHDQDVNELLTDLHRLTFADTAPMADFAHGYWWIASEDGKEAGFIGYVPSTHYAKTAYFYRVGVLPKYRGMGLQRRMMLVMERHARLMQYRAIVTDTMENIPSANNIIACGYKLFAPAEPWGHAGALYWRKQLISV